MRITIHYIIALTALSLYGGQVWPLLETIPSWMLGITTAGPLLIMRLIRGPLEKHLVVGRKEPAQARAQFFLDLALMVVVGIAVLVINRLVHRFPLSYGFGFLWGCLVFGFFIGLDMALARERTLIQSARRASGTWKLPQKLYPMTHKFSLVAFVATVFLVIVLAMTVARDFAWLAQADRTQEALSQAQRSVIIEILFVMGIMLALVANLIFSYSRNLRILFENETDILESVSNGDLSQMVPVVTNDEFGYIAGHTNTMIDGLRHRSKLMSSLELAAEVQRSLLPKKPAPYPDVDLSGTSLYCDQTGGDYYDFLTFPGKRLGIVVADSAGHGVGSALHMTTARAFLKFGAMGYDDGAGFVTQVNRYLTADSQDTGRFVVAFLLELDHPHGMIRWIRAGSDPALVYDPSQGKMSTLDGEGVALGVMSDYTYRESGRMPWAPGLIILIATDGIRESRNRANQMYGNSRMQAILSENAHLAAAEIQQRLIDDVKAFSQGMPQEDDVTLVVVKLMG